MCLCYTNHALDDFLLSLHEDGLPLKEIVRIGSSPKIHDTIKDRCLGELSLASFDRNQTRRFAALKGTQKSAEADLKELKQVIVRRHWGPKWWRTVSPFLQNGDQTMHEAYLELCLPGDSGSNSSGGMRVVGKRGKAANDDFLWQQWCAGAKRSELLKGLPVYTPSTETGVSSIWKLDRTGRRQLMTRWQEEWVAPTIQEAADCMHRFNQAARDLTVLRSETKVSTARCASVVGCTTTAAAKNFELLAQIQPTIVLIEEAAEILEANVLTALGRSVRQLIMIGDHLQLRPKLECYDLRKESGKCIDFDVSLFERLATQPGFPIHTLSVQHRMRPEISSLIKPTYPALQDHPSVLGRDNIRGLTSNVAFIAHEKLESDDEERALLGTGSKVNEHEVSLTLAVLRYLLQQGYQQSEIVIMTPYLGQLMRIRQELLRAGTINVTISDQDRNDIKKLDPDADVSDDKDIKKKGDNKKDSKVESLAEKGSNGPVAFDEDSSSGEEEEESSTATTTTAAALVQTVRVTTIDNFQGEEARIIIASLVRSNDRGEIGFVSGKERANVLLSRARDGLILIGNETTLRNAKSAVGRKLWTGVLDQLQAANQVFSGLPARCEVHRVEPAGSLCSADAFKALVPDGGCCKPCGYALPSCPFQHACSMKCHPCPVPLGAKAATMAERQAAFHAVLQCRELLVEKCPATQQLEDGEAHYIERVCCEGSGRPCQVRVRDQCPQGHIMSRLCCEKLAPAKCEVCKKVQAALKKQAEEDQARKMEIQRLEEAQLQMRLKLDEERCALADRLQAQRIQKETDMVATELRKVRQSLSTVDASMAEAEEASLQQQRASAVVPSRPAKAPMEDLVSRVAAIAESAPSPVSTAGRCDTPAAVVSSAPTASTPVPAVALPNTAAIPSAPTPTTLPPSAPARSTESTSVASTAVAPSVPPASAPAPSGDPGKEQQQRLSKITAMLRVAGKEQWMQLFNLAEASSTLGGSVGTAARACVLLCQVQLSGYSRELLREAEALVQEIPEGLDEQALLTAVVVFACFTVHRGDPTLRMTTVKYGELYLQLVEAARGGAGVDLLPKEWARTVKAACAAAKKEPSTASSTAALQQKSPTAKDDWAVVKAAFKANPPAQKQNQSSAPGKKAKSNSSSPSEALDKLMEMIGLETIKQSLISQYHRISLAAEQGASPASSFNTRFDGNPGTGKTTVARLYAEFLREVQVLPETALVKETTGSKLITVGVRGLTTMLEELKEAGGGVIFVDEAYQLNPQNDREGRQVLDFLLTHAEKMRGEYGSVVWVFAGYKKDMEKLFEHNPGLSSRFPHNFHFEDYTDEELLSIFEDILERGGMQDAEVKPTTPAAVKKPSKSLAMSGAGAPAGGMYGGMYGAYALDKPDETDQWGNRWVWDKATSTFEDPYGNVTGYGAANLGSADNPLVSRSDNTMWCYDAQRTVWYDQNNTARTSTYYPNKPPPVQPMRRVKFTVSDAKWSRIAIRRLGKGRGRLGFGNARAVRNLFETTRNRQAARIEQERKHRRSPNIFLFERNDLLGPRADMDSLKRSRAYQTLLAMEGLKEVKAAVEQLLTLVQQNAVREDAEQPMLDIALNRVFVGNPGTGKTTVAALYATILADLGLLSKGEVILKNPSDFIGSALGSSEMQTRSILAQAEGCVLVIDEAYGLNPSTGSGGAATQDPYKTAVIDTIVAQVQGVPGEDRAVVMLGYRKQMEEMMAAANPGLSGRFQMSNAFEFSDYDDPALIRILQSKAKADGLQVDLATAVFAVKRLAKARAMPNFRNAGEVANLLSLAKLNFQTRNALLSRGQQRDKLIKEDFCPRGQLPVHSEEEEIFADLTGCDQILAKLREYRDAITLAKKMGKDPKTVVEFNFLFVGSPGTGKTTVARKMGQLFHSLGMLPTDEVVETTAADLVTGFVGQAAKKAAEVIHSARGKVLFIDEAYQLNPQKGGPYMQEAVDSMVQAMTSQELKGQVVIILAGYESDIDGMLRVNQGLRSRFSEKIQFSDFTDPVICEMLSRNLSEGHGLSLGPCALEALPSIAQRLSTAPNFGNGRDVATLAQRVYRVLAGRLGAAAEDDFDSQQAVTAADLDAALSAFLLTKQEVPTAAQSNATLPIIQQPPQFANAYASPPPVRLIHKATAMRQELPDEAQGSDAIPAAAAGNPFLVKLQDLLDARGLNSQQGVERLSQLDPSSSEMRALAQEIADTLQISVEEAQEKLRGWQKDQKNVRDAMQEQEREMEKARKEKRRALVPIWRCAVCGAANKPYIACYVAPYIVRYDEVDIE